MLNNIKFVFVMLVLLPSICFGGTKIFSYGFEDWTGDCSTTPGYPFYLCSDANHYEGTEVISSCNSNDADNWQPHGGSNFFYEQAYSGISSDDCLAVGDDPQTINTYNRIDLSSVAQVVQDEIFVHFYFRFEGADGPTGNMKFLDLETNGIYNGSEDMEVWSHFYTSTAEMAFYDERETSWGSSVAWPGEVNPLTDGVWHSYAIWAKLSTGELKVWMDTTDWNSPTVSRSGYHWYNAGDDTPATQFEYLYIHENYSATSPSASLQFALDDIEVWDGIPGAIPTISGCDISGVDIQ
jgi:hypothetical protein